MMMVSYIIGGLLMLVLGGEALVRSSVSLANSIGIPIIIISLTIVSLGTSAPEMVISIMAVTEGHPDIALGNVIGSNIANILLAMGLTALVFPITTNPDITKRDGMLMVLVTVIMVIFVLGGEIARFEGIILLGILVGYLFNLFRRTKKTPDPELIEELTEEAQFSYPTMMAVPMLLLGFGLLLFGADILVAGASDMASAFGVSEAVIGATIVAIGTSAPEVVTCVVAAYRKHSEVAVGNIVGSNLFNIAAVLGVAATISPIEVAQQFIDIDIWIMLGVSALLIPMMMTDKRITRLEGGFLFTGYLAYILYQYLFVTTH
ncbi:MAG: calcium/sodium antiporter [Rickettsiales bacterium]|nr:calcium/sodium antiporter [Rickettsiales bacterium]